MRHERRGRHAVRGTMLPVYEWIIDLYAPYVLVRCAGFTNDRSQALMIGVYTLITTCLMANRLDHTGQLGIAVDVIMEVVGPDVVAGCGDDTGRWDCGGELLIADERMQDLAHALNLLDRSLREALVLRHFGGLLERTLARVLNQPVTDVAARIARGERLLACHLNGSGRDDRSGPREVQLLLARFEAELDAQWVREVRDGAIDYLVRCDRRIGRHSSRGHLN